MTTGLVISGDILVSVANYMTHLDIPYYIKIIKSGTSNSYPFYPCRNCIETISFPTNSLIEIFGDYSFYYCTKLSEIDLTNCKLLNKIGSFCFARCSLLSNIIFPQNGTTFVLSDRSFYQTQLINIVFPQTLTQIYGSYCFGAIKSLYKVQFLEPSMIISINHYSFSTSTLQVVEIPSSLKILSAAFANTSVIEFTVHPSNPYFSSFNGCVYSKDFSIFYHGIPNSNNVSFHPSTIEIGSRGFMWSKIISVHFPATIFKFGQYCFYYCFDLMNVTFENCTTLTSNVFYQSSVINITLPPNLETIQAGSFYGTSYLEYLFIPKSVVNIEGAFFGVSPNLIIEFEAGSIFSFEDQFLFNIDKTVLYRYFGALEFINLTQTVITIDRSAFSSLSTLKQIHFQGFSLRYIGHSAFSDCINLETIELPSSLEVIGNLAFQSTNLTHVIMPETVYSLGDYCYSRCTSLKSINLSSSINSIPSYCFQYTGIISIVIPPSINQIYSYAFYFCSSLLSIDFSNSSYLSISSYCFSYCINLFFIQFPISLSSLGIYGFQWCSALCSVIFKSCGIEMFPVGLFSNCQSLNSVVFPPDLSKIEGRTFEYCRALINITFPSSLTSIFPYAFDGCSYLSIVIFKSTSLLQNVYSTSFSNCPQISGFYSDDCDCNISVVENVLIDYSLGHLIRYPPMKSNISYSVPEYITSIVSHSFELCKFLEIIIITSPHITLDVRSFYLANRLQCFILFCQHVNISIGTFDGVTMRCGMFITNQTIQNILQLNGISSDYLNPCYSFPFQRAQFDYLIQYHYQIFLFLISVVN